MAVALRRGILLLVILLLVADEINMRTRGWRSLFRVRYRVHRVKIQTSKPILPGEDRSVASDATYDVRSGPSTEVG